MILKKIISSALLFIPTVIFAQNEAFKVSGSVDFFYNYENPSAYDADGNKVVLTKTSFTGGKGVKAEALQLGMATIKGDYTYKKINVVVDLGFGSRASQCNYQDANHSLYSAMKQAYISYSFSDNLKLTGGTWATHIGYEVADAYANKNYSMSYMFTYDPFSHAGLKLDYVKGKHNFMFGITQPADRRQAFDGDGYQFIAQYGFTEKKWSILANYYGGPFKFYYDDVAGLSTGIKSNVNQLDVVANYDLTSKTHIGYNGTVRFIKANVEGEASKNFMGNAVYFGHQSTKWLNLNLRAEYFNLSTADLGLIGSANQVLSTTLSGNVTLKKFTIIPEYRFDMTQEGAFGVKGKTLGTMIIAGIYKF